MRSSDFWGLPGSKEGDQTPTGFKGHGLLTFTSLGLGTPLEEGQDLAGSTVPSSSEGELVLISKTGNLISFTEP